MRTRIIFLASLLLASTPAFAGDQPPRWVAEGPYAEAKAYSIDVPMEVFANMLFVEVEVGGQPRRFVFDTGSPSMMSRALADELGLEAVDTREGRDSHGNVVETDVVQADFLLGEVLFRKVPAFVAEFPKTAQCLFDGVLGSEMLPLCAWQIDVRDGVLRCATNVSALDHVDGATAVELHGFGYPHAPFFDVQLADDARSKAMFDTGSPEYLAISPPDFDGARRNDGVGRTVQGHGSIGGSIGGRAPVRQQLQLHLKSLAIGDLELGSVDAVLRESPPSLLGAALLEHFIVTLDQRSSRAWFDRYSDAPLVRRSFGFGVDFEGTPSVSLLWNKSSASRAGLRVGQKIGTINGEAVTGSCESLRRTVRAMSESDTLDIEWDGGSATLERESAFVD